MSGGPLYEFTSPTAGNKIEKVTDPASAPTQIAGNYNFLVPPTGEILATNLTNVAEIYTSTDAGISDRAPRITSVPHCLVPGLTYILRGVQLNGHSQGTAHGDDVQSSYGVARVEAAAERAIEIVAKTYGSIKSILDNKLDRRPAPKRPAETAPIRHSNIRGPRYYH